MATDEIKNVAKARDRMMTTVLAFLQYAEHGGVYFSNLFTFLNEHAHGSADDHELCGFLIRLIQVLLTTNVEELEKQRHVASQESVDARDRRFAQEREFVRVTQTSLVRLGGVDSVVHVIARAGPAGEILKASLASRELASAMLELGSALLLYGNEYSQQQLCEALVRATLDAARYGRDGDFLFCIRSMLRRSIPEVRKMRETSQQPGLTAEKTKIVFKRLEDQVVEQTLELKFVQELCEGHNASLQNFLRSQSDYFRHIGQGVQLAAGNVDIVSQLIEYAEELVAAVNISVDDAFVRRRPSSPSSRSGRRGTRRCSVRSRSSSAGTCSRTARSLCCSSRCDW